MPQCFLTAAGGAPLSGPSGEILVYAEPGGTVRVQVRLQGGSVWLTAVILAVGIRVRSPTGTRFRQWATGVLAEFAVKGFTMDDRRLKAWRKVSPERRVY